MRGLIGCARFLNSIVYRWMTWTLLGLGGAAAFAQALPGVENPARARTNYILNCQGCHGHDGSGSLGGAVPQMKDYVSNFLRVPGGRAFLVQVPGSANAAIGDAELAELLNWMLPTISPAEMPADFAPYSANEVTRLRQTLETDVIARRAALVTAIAKLGLPSP